jgi:hypothetical protein
VLRRLTWLWLLVFLIPAPVDAQPTTGPIPNFVLDARGSLARFKPDEAVASLIQLGKETLPTRGLGVTLGGHVYVLHSRRITIGLGGEMILAGDSRTVETDDDAPTTTAPPTVTTRMSGFAPQISLNFGRDEGWSYISGGLGVARMTTGRDDVPVTGTAARTRMLNYGGGARWFNTPRLAFTFDIRWYAISPRVATATVPAYPRAKFMVLSGGVAFK